MKLIRPRRCPARLARPQARLGTLGGVLVASSAGRLARVDAAEAALRAALPAVGLPVRDLPIRGLSPAGARVASGPAR